MNPAAPGPVDNVFAALVQGVPILILQILVCVVLLVIGIAIYVSLTPFREHELVARGNTAAGIALGGAILALALPLAAMLATSTALLDIAVWGVVALILQLLTLAAVTLAMRNLGALIKADNVAAAIVLAAAQLAVALLNAAAMVPT